MGATSSSSSGTNKKDAMDDGDRRSEKYADQFFQRSPPTYSADSVSRDIMKSSNIILVHPEITH